MSETVNQSILPYTAKINEDNHLEIGGCDTVELVERYGTPLIVYDEDSIRKCCSQYKNAFSSYDKTKVLFAGKAFMTKTICHIVQEEGLGIDVVSGGEIYTALKSSFKMENLYFNGNNKTLDELELALDSGIGRITVDNFMELAILDNIAKYHGKTVKILLRITPGIECHTHEYIQTGHLDSKFGFDLTQLDEAIELIKDEYTNLELVGLHAHIGSQIFETQVYHDLVGIMAEQFAYIKDKFDIELEEMNIGGGLGIRYTEGDDPPSIYQISEVIVNSLKENIKKYSINEPILIVEPGRSLVSASGVTLYTSGSYKQVPEGRKYVAVDGGMADNPRPSMYQADYKAMVANKAGNDPEEVVTIAGRFCESGDILIKDVKLPTVDPGDIVCLLSTGAYNYSMASNYNRVPRPACVLVHKGQSDVIIERETYENIISLDRIPKRLTSKTLEGSM